MLRPDDPQQANSERLPDAEIQLSGAELAELMRVKLDSGLPFRFQARGWSMAPFVRDQDVITIQPLHGDQPGIGDIVAFRRPGAENLVVHRVVGRQGEFALIKGDGIDNTTDGLIPFTSLLGKVTQIERKGHGIWLGLGPERFMIAWLSRSSLLTPLRLWFVRWRDLIFHKRLHP